MLVPGWWRRRQRSLTASYLWLWFVEDARRIGLILTFHNIGKEAIEMKTRDNTQECQVSWKKVSSWVETGMLGCCHEKRCMNHLDRAESLATRIIVNLAP